MVDDSDGAVFVVEANHRTIPPARVGMVGEDHTISLADANAELHPSDRKGAGEALAITLGKPVG